ncbi:hypothetical protein M407DRAFT_9353 [Tulasnella calospora MUT 4182]|uniref:Uncharacterized protein n=1 Tax=Tulasnella calospora MUT 4182 TaxID=1051891 RepID=A0A0C3QEQ8_9AGAM|nr:hypothetical protein M407DRAFT_9353 [Tulasnella calospora MUT 4182]
MPLTRHNNPSHLYSYACKPQVRTTFRTLRSWATTRPFCDVFGTNAGLAGLGYYNVANGSDSTIGKYLAMEEDPDEEWEFGRSFFGIGGAKQAPTEGVSYPPPKLDLRKEHRVNGSVLKAPAPSVKIKVIQMGVLDGSSKYFIRAAVTSDGVIQRRCQKPQRPGSSLGPACAIWFITLKLRRVCAGTPLFQF